LLACIPVSAAHSPYNEYVAARANVGKPKLTELDDWMLLALPAAVSARTPAHLTKAELSKLMTWKLTKGVNPVMVCVCVRVCVRVCVCARLHRQEL
jgi:hypothetical protein